MLRVLPDAGAAAVASCCTSTARCVGCVPALRGNCPMSTGPITSTPSVIRWTASNGHVRSAPAICRTPTMLDCERVCALPVAAGTAWTALFEYIDPANVKTVLVQGGAGGVGTFAIQLAKLAGLHVIATTSGPNRALVESLGADEVIDYRSEDFTRKVKDVDLVLDTVGGDTQKQSYSVLRKGGTLLTIVGQPDAALAREHGVEAKFVRANVTGTRLEEISGLIDAGKIQVIVEKEFPLSDAKAAHLLSESGRARGKILLRVI